jgi:hypothetical protein
MCHNLLFVYRVYFIADFKNELTLFVGFYLKKLSLTFNIFTFFITPTQILRKYQVIKLKVNHFSIFKHKVVI